MRKILPFEDNPPFKTYTFWAHYLGILICHSKKIEGFLFNNFIVLSFFMLFSRTGYTAGYKLRKKFEKINFNGSKEQIVDSLKVNILQDHYAILILDRNKLLNICGKTEYRDWIIYGFDDDAEVFFGAGYVKNAKTKTSHYKSIKIPYVVLIESFPYEAENHGYKYTGKYLNHQFLWLDDKKIDEPPNLTIIKYKIFCLAYKTLFPWNQQGLFRVFFIINNLRKKKLEKPFDLRPLKAFLENKQNILHLINYYMPDSNVYKSYKTIFGKAQSILYLATKYNVKSNFNSSEKRSVIKKINLLFLSICKDEPQILREFYKFLHKSKNDEL